VPYLAAIKEMSELILKRILKPWLISDWVFHLTWDGVRWRRSLRVLLRMASPLHP
jgi:hypothetical protein